MNPDILGAAFDDLLPWLVQKFGNVLTAEEVELYLTATGDLAMERAFWVSRLSEVEMVEAVYDALLLSQAQGTGLAGFMETYEAIFEANGWGELAPWHAETVWRTNVAQAQSAVAYRLQDATREDLPYWLIDETNDERTCDYCIHFCKEPPYIYRADDPIWNTQYGIQHFNCRRTIIALTEDEVTRRGWPVANIHPSYIDPETGRVVFLEPDKGFGGIPHLDDYGPFRDGVEAAMAAMQV